MISDIVPLWDFWHFITLCFATNFNKFPYRHHNVVQNVALGQIFIFGNRKIADNSTSLKSCKTRHHYCPDSDIFVLKKFFFYSALFPLSRRCLRKSHPTTVIFFSCISFLQELSFWRFLFFSKRGASFWNNVFVVWRRARLQQWGPGTERGRSNHEWWSCALVGWPPTWLGKDRAATGAMAMMGIEGTYSRKGSRVLPSEAPLFRMRAFDCLLSHSIWVGDWFGALRHAAVIVVNQKTDSSNMCEPKSRPGEQNTVSDLLYINVNYHHSFCFLSSSTKYCDLSIQAVADSHMTVLQMGQNAVVRRKSA